MSSQGLQGDDKLIVLFRHSSVLNPSKTREAGRPIHDDYEEVEIRIPGSRSTTSIHPVTERSHWGIDPITGDQVPITYAERFSDQYRQFKAHAQQTKSGTPLGSAPFLTEARRAELRALNIYTVEALASLDGQELKNIGQGGRDLKNQAEAFIEDAKKGVVSMSVQAELEALRARLQAAESAADIMRSKMVSGEAQFEVMSIEALRDFIVANTGVMPQGNSNRRTLIRMAMECKPRDNDKAA